MISLFGIKKVDLAPFFWGFWMPFLLWVGYFLDFDAFSLVLFGFSLVFGYFSLGIERVYYRYSFLITCFTSFYLFYEFQARLLGFYWLLGLSVLFLGLIFLFFATHRFYYEFRSVLFNVNVAFSSFLLVFAMFFVSFTTVASFLAFLGIFLLFKEEFYFLGFPWLSRGKGGALFLAFIGLQLIVVSRFLPVPPIFSAFFVVFSLIFIRDLLVLYFNGELRSNLVFRRVFEFSLVFLLSFFQALI